MDKEISAAGKRISDLQLQHNLTQELDLLRSETVSKQTVMDELDKVTQEEMNKITTLENKVIETVQDEAVTEHMEEGTMKQYESLISVHSTELEKRQK